MVARAAACVHGRFRCTLAHRRGGGHQHSGTEGLPGHACAPGAGHGNLRAALRHRGAPGVCAAWPVRARGAGVLGRADAGPARSTCARARLRAGAVGPAHRATGRPGAGGTGLSAGGAGCFSAAGRTRAATVAAVDAGGVPSRRRAAGTATRTRVAAAAEFRPRADAAIGGAARFGQRHVAGRRHHAAAARLFDTARTAPGADAEAGAGRRGRRTAGGRSASRGADARSTGAVTDTCISGRGRGGDRNPYPRGPWPAPACRQRRATAPGAGGLAVVAGWLRCRRGC